MRPVNTPLASGRHTRVLLRPGEGRSRSAPGRPTSSSCDEDSGGPPAPGLAGLLTAAGPEQLLERAALLDAAGDHRSTVLDVVTAAQQGASRARNVARTALARADQRRQQTQTALASADAVQSSAAQHVTRHLAH